MNGEKNLKIALLADHYSALLTDKQRNVIDLYYNEDLSLGEIAEHENITRQGVRDSIKRGEQTLLELENVFGLADKTDRLMKVAGELDRLAETQGGSISASLSKAAEDIRSIII